jgi:hypothetical protein
VRELWIRSSFFRVIALVGCAGCVGFLASCSSTTASPAEFVGNWTFSAGTLSGTGLCPGLPTDLTGQTFTLTKGTTSDLLSTLGTCQVLLNVNGTKASAVAGQMCQFTIGGMAVDVTVSSWTLDSSNGMTLTTNATGSALGVCQFTLTGDASKSATPDASAG